MRIAIIGDFNSDNKTHITTNEALVHADLQHRFIFDWIPTEAIDEKFGEITKNYQGFLIATGSPYKNMAGVLRIIEFARLNQVPTLGTCGGFQHMVIEFARHVLHLEDAQHAEYDPYASKLIITPLTCSLKGKTLEVMIDKRVFTNSPVA